MTSRHDRSVVRAAYESAVMSLTLNGHGGDGFAKLQVAALLIFHACRAAHRSPHDALGEVFDAIREFENLAKAEEKKAAAAPSMEKPS